MKRIGFGNMEGKKEKWGEQGKKDEGIKCLSQAEV